MNSASEPCLLKIRRELEDNSLSAYQALKNQRLADLIVCGGESYAIMLNAIAWQCRHYSLTMTPEDVSPCIYEIWRRPDWRWAAYVHIDNDHLRGFLWRVAQRTTNRWLRFESTKELSLDSLPFDPLWDATVEGSDDLLFDLRLYIERIQDKDNRVRLTLLMYLETADIEETATRLGIKTESARRYLRRGLNYLKDWLKNS